MYDLYLFQTPYDTWRLVANVDGNETAYAAYDELCNFAKVIGAVNVALCDAATGEVIIDMATQNEEE